MSLMIRLRQIRLAAPIAIALGCTQGNSEERSDSGRVVPMPSADSVAVQAAVPPSLPGVSADPIQWDGQKAADALRQLGLTVTVAPVPVHEAHFDPSATRFIAHQGVDSAEVLVFIYGGAISAGRDLEALDTAAASPRTVRVSWRAPAQLVTDNNIVAIVVSENDALRGRIADMFRPHTPQ